jgi:hypothetical protein
MKVIEQVKAENNKLKASMLAQHNNSSQRRTGGSQRGGTDVGSSSEQLDSQAGIMYPGSEVGLGSGAGGATPRKYGITVSSQDGSTATYDTTKSAPAYLSGNPMLKSDSSYAKSQSFRELVDPAPRKPGTLLPGNGSRPGKAGGQGQGNGKAFDKRNGDDRVKRRAMLSLLYSGGAPGEVDPHSGTATSTQRQGPTAWLDEDSSPPKKTIRPPSAKAKHIAATSIPPSGTNQMRLNQSVIGEIRTAAANVDTRHYELRAQNAVALRRPYDVGAPIQPAPSATLRLPQPPLTDVRHVLPSATTVQPQAFFQPPPLVPTGYGPPETLADQVNYLQPQPHEVRFVPARSSQQMYPAGSYPPTNPGRPTNLNVHDLSRPDHGEAYTPERGPSPAGLGQSNVRPPAQPRMSPAAFLEEFYRNESPRPALSVTSPDKSRGQRLNGAGPSAVAQPRPGTDSLSRLSTPDDTLRSLRGSNDVGALLQWTETLGFRDSWGRLPDA